MDATELGRWTRFAAKGGIGKCSALQDCIAEEPVDLMFMKDDEITVLMHLADKEDMYLGYCEGVVGRFSGSCVRFHNRLKKPVITKRSSSLASARSRPSSSQSAMTVSARDTASPSLPARASPALYASQLTYSSSVSSTPAGSPIAARLTHSASASASPSPHNSPLRVPRGLHDERRSRSMSRSSISIALESAPITPADFSPAHTEQQVRIATDMAQPEPPSILAPAFSPVVPPEEPATKDGDYVDSVKSRDDPDHNAPLRMNHDSSYSFYNETDRSSRISAALSDGEVGIGLSLLQDFMGGHGEGNGDDTSSIHSRQGEAKTPPVDEYLPSPVPSASANALPLDALPSRGDVQSVALSLSQYSVSPRSAHFPIPHSPSRASLRPSLHDSEGGSEEWEGASDIYDNYRYSRYSVASRMSRMSKGSFSPALAGGHDVPPVPPELNGSGLGSVFPTREFCGRPSMDSLRTGGKSSMDCFGEKTGSGSGSVGRPSVDSVADRPATAAVPSNVAPLNVVNASERVPKNKPSPLSLVSELSPFPLLHSAFGSPPLSPTPGSTESFASPTLTSPVYPTSSGGAASALRQGLEIEHGPRAMSLVVREDDNTAVHSSTINRSFGHDIVIEDDARAGPTSPQSLDRRVMSPASEPAPPPHTPLSPQPTSPQSLAPSPLSPSFPNPHPPNHSKSAAPQPQPITRPLNVNRPPPSPNARTSLFLPHPHAPKPTQSSAGPLYGRQPVPYASQFPPNVGPPPGSVFHTLRLACTTGRPRQTIYARFEHDLTSSIGPVPISFSLEPQMNIPANRPGMSRSLRAAPVSSSPQNVEGPVSADVQRTASPKVNGTEQAQNIKPEGPTKVIPRANFFPQVPTNRPRSRSFSGFDSPFAELALPKDRSRDEGGVPAPSPSMLMLTKRSKSAIAATPIAPVSLPAPQRAMVSHSASVVRAVHAPSPLSLSQNNVVVTYPSALHPPSPQSLPSPNPSTRSVVTSPISFSPPGSPVAPAQTRASAPHPKHDTGAVPLAPHRSKIDTIPEDDSIATFPLAPKFPPTKANSVPVIRHSKSFVASSTRKTTAELPPRSMSSQARRSDDAKRLDDLLSTMITPPPRRSPSEPQKRNGEAQPGVGLPRISTSMTRVQSLQGERSPSSSVCSSERDQKTVQVQDMDFEMIRPAIPQSPLAANSVDSLPLPSPVGTKASSIDIPASPSPTTAARAPSLDHGRLMLAKPMDSTDMEAHRQRELRWISTMSSVPPSQARRSKKVRKMVLEGVPASVRYLVWAHLTDSKAKRMDGLYSRLLRREKVTASAQIERDVRLLSADQSAMRDDSLMNLLQAYLSMVPDIRYSKGLCSIASQLLLLSPEEDAFWTFISLMDTHLRSYFSSNSIQMDVDAALFGKAVEVNDSALAKKIFIDMAVPPASICKPWYTSLFVDALSPEYLHRVWDVFLFEGVSFLFRVGIALFTCCRQLLFQCSRQDSLFAILSRPPANCLPSTPDALIELAFSVKLKDEDVRKQRSKMEAQVKRQTQSRSLSSGHLPGVSAPSISLPRN